MRKIKNEITTCFCLNGNKQHYCLPRSPADRIWVFFELTSGCGRWRVRPVLVGCGGGGGGSTGSGPVGVDVDFAHASAKVVQELDAGGRVDGWRPDVGRQVVGYLGGAVRETGAELVGVH